MATLNRKLIFAPTDKVLLPVPTIDDLLAQAILKEFDIFVRSVQSKQPVAKDYGFGVMASDATRVAQKPAKGAKAPAATQVLTSRTKPALAGFDCLAGHDPRPGNWVQGALD